MGLGEVILFWGWELSQAVFFLGGTEGEVWLFFKVTRLSFFLFFKELFLWWCGMGWFEKEGGWVYSFFSFIIW